MFAELLGLSYLGLLVFTANLGDDFRKLPSVTLGLAWGLQFGMVSTTLGIVLSAWLFHIDPTNPEAAPISLTVALLYGAFASLCTLFNMAVLLSPAWREGLQAHVFRNGYAAHAILPNIALLLAVFAVVNVWSIFLNVGGTEGIAESVAGGLTSAVLDALIYLFLALFGVGFIVRRDVAQTVKRLGLRVPTRQDWQAGIGTGIGLYGLVVCASGLWVLSTTPEVFEQQTRASGAIFEAFSGSLASGLMLAVLTGVSEETLFRGALQPIFGILWVSVLFTALHLQYSFTPASLIIFGVSLGFGLLRQRASTSAAIIAHTVYNAIPFVLVSMGA